MKSPRSIHFESITKLTLFISSSFVLYLVQQQKNGVNENKTEGKHNLIWC